MRDHSFEKKMEKGIQKLHPTSFFDWRTPEEIPLKFNNKLSGLNISLFILFYISKNG